mmetsp:Transcript_14703/g.22052  ORF Transcript_14703/g.22052 Transcript_14703/m.22052 type:complete len:124 (+) Transcript_14703:188-559(+)
MFHISAYLPFFANSSVWLPSSNTTPSPNTIMLSALRMVPSLCAMTRQVRAFPNTSSACWIEFSVRVSKAEVASSNTTKGGSFKRHLAIAALCFSPPESFNPRSPTIVSHPSGSLRIKPINCAA